jgi:tetratricopeptide (TPR) repeat protein
MRSSFITAALLLAMLASAAWRLDNPPRAPKEENWLAAGTRQLDTGHYFRAYERIRKVLAINAGNQAAQSMLEALKIYGYLVNRDPSPATIRRFEETLARNPDSPYVYMIGGELHARAGDLDTAISLHRKAAELKPDLPHNWYGIGMAYRMAGDQESAQVALARAANSNTRGLYYLQLARQYFHDRRFRDAAVAYRKSHELSPRRLEARLGEVRCLLLAGRFDQSAGAADALLGLIEPEPRKLLRRARHIGVPSAFDSFDEASGLTLQLIAEYVMLLQRWGSDRAAGRRVSTEIPDTLAGSPLLPVIRLDVANLP